MDRTQPKKSNRLLRFALIALLILMMPIVVLATTVAATGTIMVKVHDAETNLFVPVPALLVDLAVFAAPHVIPEHELADVRAEVAPYRDALRAVAEEIEDCPDVVLVEVLSADEHVQISKEGRSFYIDVDSPDGNVSVKVPARLLSRMIDLI